jgi:hypothetical protein
MRVILHPEASREVEAAFYWYEGKAENLGLKFIEEVGRAIETIRAMPASWPLYRRDLGVRRFSLCIGFPSGFFTDLQLLQ